MSSEDGKVFVWKKKYEKLGIKDIGAVHLKQINEEKWKEKQKELAKINQRKIEREREKEERLKELERQQREKEAAQFDTWEAQEDDFHLKQAKLRCKIRIKEGRAKPIDLLARYVDTFTEKKEDDRDDEIELPPFRLAEPYLCLNGLRLNDLEDLQEDIKIYKKLDNEENLDFWNDIKIIVDDEINKLKKFQSDSKTTVERRDGVNSAVADDVLEIFENKPADKLKDLQRMIEKKLDKNAPGLDVSYWESLLSKLKAYLARSRLKELHLKNLEKRANKKIKIENILEEDDKQNVQEQLNEFELNEEKVKPSFRDENDVLLQGCIEDYERGRYSPVPLTLNSLDEECKLIDEEADLKELNMKRRQILNQQSSFLPMTTAEPSGSGEKYKSKDEQAFERIAKQGMNDEERVFKNEITLQQNLPWSDKYKPRKPRYFNRVHTGFEWNKYNQTHYDVDNPPPKIVQGYKFNIFYPDLIDKSTTPTYKFENCPDSKDFKIIKFIAGPPYEDLAFKIVNREWNNSYKSGFKNQFNNNILQLWFHFKRLRYRR